METLSHNSNGHKMDVEFPKSATLDKDRVLRQMATLGGRVVECRCGGGVIIRFEQLATEAGIKTPSYEETKANPNTIASLLQLYWEHKIINERYDDDTRTSVTLSEDDLDNLP
jgi:hypothetical protein